MVDSTLGGLAPAHAGDAAAPKTPSDRLSTPRVIAYALPSIPLMGLMIPVGFLLPAYYTGELGFSLTAWGLVMLLARVWDGLTDPFVGMFCDRHGSRWGRRRHWLVIGAPITMVGLALLFVPTLITNHVTVAYVLVAMFFMQLGTTLFGLNMSAWGGELSDDYHERTRIMGWKGIAMSIAPVVAMGIPAFIEQTNPGATTGDRIEAITLFLVIAIPITTAIAIFTVPERKYVRPEKKADDLSVLQSLKLVVTNRLMLRVVASLVLMVTPTSVMAALYVFYVSFVVEAPQLASTLLLLPLFSSMLAVPLWMRVAKGREKHKVLTVGYLLTAVAMSGFVWVGPGDWIAFAVLSTICGVCTGTMFLILSILTDVVDTDRERTGEQRTGTFFAVVETIMKAAPTLAVALLFPVLDLIGFDPSGKHNTPQTIAAVKYAYAFAPTVPLLLAAWLMWNFPLGSKEQAELRDRLNAARAAATAEG